MEANTKKVLGVLAVVAAVGGGFYLIKKGKKLLSGAKMNFALLGFRIHKMDLQEVQFAVKLRCYNPTKAPITLAVNQVVAKYKGSAIAYSTPDIKGLTIHAGKTQEPEIVFQVPYLNLMGKGLSMALLQNTEQLKADMSFTLTLSVNGETITTTQNLTDDNNMNGLALGQLGIVSGPRNTQDGRKFNNLIKKATGKEVFVKNGNVLETVESCIDIVASHHREVEDLARKLKADNLKDTCRNIFNFAYNYLQYQKDDDGTEQLRTPARSWLDGQVKFKQYGKSSGGIDCDDYSIFCGSILKCLGIPFKFRITKYDGKQHFQHIYVFVPALGDSEDEIIIDPVLSKFDYQKPYSFEKSDFSMSPIQMVAGIHGIDGMTGTTSLGLPIYALSGIDVAGGSVVQENHTELMAIISGVDFEDTINGLGEADDAAYKYIIRTRDFLLKNKDNKGKMAHIQNPDQFISMLDQAIKFWNTPQRDAVLDKLSTIEDKLAENGLIKYDADAIEGISELDDLDNKMDGLGRRKRRKGRFFKALKKVGKKVGGVAKKVVKAIVRFNPLTIAIRGGLLAALRLNMFGISKKLQYAYLPDNLAAKHNIDPAKLADLKKRLGKVKKLFNGLQGKESNLRKAILKGAKQKSPDFSLKGMDGLLAELKGLEAIGVLAEMGDLGVVATAASVGAASGVLATISKWLKPVKNIFNKVKGKAAVAKMLRREKKGKEIDPETRQTAAEYQQYLQQQQQSQQNQEQITPTSPPDFKSGNFMAQQPNVNVPATPFMTQQSPTNMARTPTPVGKGISKGAKVGIGIGVAALIGTGAYFLFRGNNNKPQTNSKPTKSNKKKSLGAIELS
jgi:hypothetical protein